MGRVRLLSLNAENMGDLIPASLESPAPDGRSASLYWRARMLAEIVRTVKPDIVGLVEAPATEERTEVFVRSFLNSTFRVAQGAKRGTLGLAFLIREGLDVRVDSALDKDDSQRSYDLRFFDADGDGIKEVYNWANRVPLEVVLAGPAFSAPVTFVLIHAKSKGVFIPGDLFAYEKLSRANRMKLRAQAAAIRKRLDGLIDDQGKGRVVVMGDFNDGPEFDVYAATLGGALLEPVMGSVWDPNRVLHNTHAGIPAKDRWTIDYADRILNPLQRSRYGKPTEMRSWIDHILVSPELKDAVVPESAGIVHCRPRVEGLPSRYRSERGTDHHAPFVDVEL